MTSLISDNNYSNTLELNYKNDVQSKQFKLKIAFQNLKGNARALRTKTVSRAIIAGCGW